MLNQIKNAKAFQPVKKFFSQPILCAFLALAGWLVCDFIMGIFMPESFPDWGKKAISLLVMSIYMLWVKKKLGNGFTLGFRFDNLGKSLLLSTSALAVSAYFISQSIKVFLLLPVELSGKEFVTALLNQIFFGLLPGVSEEYQFRVILMGIVMHFTMGKKHRLALAVGLSSVLFGVLHLLNLTHAPLVDTIYQVFYAFAVGVLFAAVYARTRNILAPMIAHSLWDITENFHLKFYPSLTEMPLELQPIMSEEMQNIIITVVLVAVGLYLLRPAKHHEIEEHWGSLAAEESAV